jgi:hypothetical protein
MNYERDQAINPVVLMFWMSCCGVRKPVFWKLPWPNRNHTTRMGVSLQYIERANLQCPIEKKFDIVMSRSSWAAA